MTFKGKRDIAQHEKTPEEGYNLYASSYVQDEEKLNRFDQKMLMRALRLLAGKKVLDLGCGTGRLAPLLRKREADDVTGLDVSEEMLAIAGQTGMYRDLVHADVTLELPFAWNTFDMVLCSMVLVHVPLKQLHNVFDEVFRVLKPGGEFYLVNLPQRRAPKLMLPSGEAIFISSFVHSDSTVMDELELAGFVEIMHDEHIEGKEHFATLIKATKPN